MKNAISRSTASSQSYDTSQTRDSTRNTMSTMSLWRRSNPIQPARSAELWIKTGVLGGWVDIWILQLIPFCQIFLVREN